MKLPQKRNMLKHALVLKGLLIPLVLLMLVLLNCFDVTSTLTVTKFPKAITTCILGSLIIDCVVLVELLKRFGNNT